MKVFISWSGEPSRNFALFLRTWLRQVVQAIKPWMSDEDIAKGSRNMVELGKELEEAEFGIVVLTRQNLGAPWINFEAGAISKSVGQASLVPLLLDVRKSDIVGPLAQFQAADAGDERDMFRLVDQMNRKLSAPLEPDILDRALRMNLPAFAAELERFHHASSTQHGPVSRRDERDVMDEILLIVRQLQAGATQKGEARLYPPVVRTENPPGSWQEKLRALDLALAEGRVSADVYREQRDVILAEAGTE
ncbi:toll/interleukin-1 receptor domain-containing protein [Actinosynnema sp. NPDC059797]